MRISVGGDENLRRLNHVGAQQQRISERELLANFAQHGDCIVPLEVADARSQIEDELPSGNFTQEVKAITKVSDYGVDHDTCTLLLDSLFGICQSARGDIHGKILDAHLTTSKSAQQRSCFRSGACAEFHNRNWCPGCLHNISCGILQNSEFGPRQVVFRQARDLFEQLRAAIIVEKLARQSLWLGGKPKRDLIDIRRKRNRFVQDHLASLMPMNCQRTCGGKKLR